MANIPIDIRAAAAVGIVTSSFISGNVEIYSRDIIGN